MNNILKIYFIHYAKLCMVGLNIPRNKIMYVYCLCFINVNINNKFSK